MSEESGSLQLSSKSVSHPVIFIGDLEPLFREAYEIISKVFKIPSHMTYLADPDSLRCIGLPGEVQVPRVGAEGYCLWDGLAPTAGPVLSKSGHTLYNRKKPPEFMQAKNNTVFNIVLAVLDAMIAHSRVYTKKKSKSICVDYDDAFAPFFTAENYICTPEQQQYVDFRNQEAHVVVTEQVEAYKRERITKFDPVTAAEEQDIYERRLALYKTETMQQLYREQDTINRFTELGDALHTLLRALPGYYQLQEILTSNPWAILATAMTRRGSKPYMFNLHHCGDLRIVQWEKEHLNEYINP